MDDDAPNDPGPNDPNVSDPLEDGTPEHPFDGIGEAINYLLNPCDILAMPGTYREGLPSIGNCRIMGSGAAATFLESPSPVTGSVIDSSLYFGEPASSAELELSNMTLKTMNVFVHAYPGDPTIPLRISIHDVTMAGGSIAVGAVGGPGPGLVRVSIENADLESVIAPQTSIGMFRSGGGSQTVTLRDSVFDGATIGFLDGYRATLAADNVHFTGSGVESSTSLLTLSVNECEFGHGGVRIRTNTNLDIGSGATATVSKKHFHEEGVILRSALSDGSDFSGGNRISLTADANLFSGSGESAAIRDVPFTFNFPQTVDITVTNNVFDGSPVGFKLDYTLPDAEPGPTQPVFTTPSPDARRASR